jgi:heme A synthase
MQQSRRRWLSFGGSTHFFAVFLLCVMRTWKAQTARSNHTPQTNKNTNTTTTSKKTNKKHTKTQGVAAAGRAAPQARRRRPGL